MHTSIRRWLFSSTDSEKGSVRAVIHRVLVDNEPFRTATNGLEMHNVDGVRIGTTASWSLTELNTQGDG
jgi:hypothetical protein